MQRLTQKGFSAIEGLLLLVIVGIIAGTGFYVFHASQKADDTYTASTDNATSASPKTTVKKDTATSMVGTVFTVKEWGITATYSGTPTLTYAVATENGVPSIGISSVELSKADPTCTAANGAAGFLEKYKANDHVSLGSADANANPVASTYVKDLKSTDYKVVDGNYYILRYPMQDCGSQASEAVQQATITKLNEVIPTLKAE